LYSAFNNTYSFKAALQKVYDSSDMFGQRIFCNVQYQHNWS